MHVSLDKATKNSKIEELKLKVQKPKVSNSFLHPNQGENAKTSNNAQKKKKKY